MKKTLLFAALAALTTGAVAQTWNFSEFTAATFTETTEVNGFKIYASSEFGVTIDANNKTVDGVSYTQRIKSGGMSQLDSLTNEPLARIYEFPVAGPGTVEYVMTSSSNSGTGRFIKFVVNGDTISKQEAPVKGELSATGVEKYSFEYTGEAANMQIFFTGGINMYMVSYTAGEGGGETPDTPDTPDTPADDLVFDAASLAAQTYSEDIVSGIYTFLCNGKTWEVDANTARFSNDSTIQYTQRIKAKSKSNTISIACPDAGTLTFGVRTGSNSDVTRTLVATQNGTEIYNKLVLESDTVEHGEGAPKAYLTHEVAVPAAGEVTITMPTGNLNYYFISFTNGQGGVQQVLDLGKLFMSGNVVVADGAARLYVYDIVGKLVATANASELDLNRVSRGIYIVKAVYADGRTQTLKIRR